MKLQLKLKQMALAALCLAAPAARAAAGTYLVVDLSGGTNAVSYPTCVQRSHEKRWGRGRLPHDRHRP